MDRSPPRRHAGATPATPSTPRNLSGEPLDLDASYWLDVVGDDSGETQCTSLVSEGGDDALGGCGDRLAALREAKKTLDMDRTSTSATQNQQQQITLSKAPPATILETPQSKLPIRAQHHLLSPFSTKLLPSSKTVRAGFVPNHFYMPPTFNENDLSLSPCRKVSVVVHVPDPESFQRDPPAQAGEHGNLQAPRLCLFPLIDEEVQPTTNGALSPTSATLRSSVSSKDVVIVNPSAFGKYIPSEVTMETARLVAQVANIPSEDWARTYRFQHVLWPDNYARSLWHLAQAMANDVLPSRQPTQIPLTQPLTSFSTTMYNNHRLLVATGFTAEKRRTLFGSSVTEGWPTDNHKSNGNTMDDSDMEHRRTILQQYGVVGATLFCLLKRLPEYAVCALSMYEIRDEDVIIDCLAPPEHNQVQLRHASDGKGAIVHGLSEVPVDSLSSLAGCLRQALSSRTRKAASASASSCARGHLMVSLKIWQSAVQHDLQTRCAVVSFLDLALYAPQTSTNGMERSDRKSPHRQQQPKHQSLQESRKVSFLRKSVSTLGGVLRGALLREAGSDTVIPYRDSTLTKVLQRSLSASDCRVVVLASVSPLSDAYDATMDTLRYVERLVVRPGTVPRSPFDKTLFRSSPQSSPGSDKSQSSSPQLLVERFAGKESVVESLVTDPRQRLAKFYKSPAIKESPPSDSEDLPLGAATGTGYMQVDPATVHQEDEKPVGDYGHTVPRSGTVVGFSSPDNTPYTPSRVFSTPLAKYVLPSPIHGGSNSECRESHVVGLSHGENSLPFRGTFDSLDTFSGLPMAGGGTPTSTGATDLEDLSNVFQSQLKEKDKIITALQEQVADGIADDAEVKLQMKLLQSQLDEKRKEIKALRVKLSSRMTDQSAFEEQAKQFQVQLEEKETEINALWSTINNGISDQAKLKEQSQLLRDQLGNKEREISSLKAELDNGVADRADVEKIAEEAIAAQDSLEQRVKELELRLSESGQKFQAGQSEIRLISQTKDALSQELHLVREQLRSLRAEHDDRQLAVMELQLQSKHLEGERQQLLKDQAEGAATIARLKKEIAQLEENSQRRAEQLKDEIYNLEHELKVKEEAQRKREAQLLEKLAQSNELLRSQQMAFSRAKEDLASVQHQERAKASQLEREMSALRQEFSKLKDDIAVIEGEKNVAVEKQKQERARNEAISTELEHTRVILGLRLSDVAELSSSLEQALAENQDLRADIARNTEALETFQAETRQRVQRVVKYRNEAAALLDSTVAENHTLVDSNNQLQSAMSKLREERDSLILDLEQSRKAKADGQHRDMAQLGSVQAELAKTKDDRNDLRRQLEKLRQEHDDLLGLLDRHHQDRNGLLDNSRKMEDDLLGLLDRHHQDRNGLLDNRRKMDDAMEMLRDPEERYLDGIGRKSTATACGGSGTLSGSLVNRRFCPNCSPAPSKPENWQGPEPRVSSRDLSVRAEEIAALLALSARKAAVGRPTTGTTASRVFSSSRKPHLNGRSLYAQEESEKEALISILQRKVDRLEKTLVFGDDSSGSVGGSQPF